ncbi:extracellular solute-binding protein [Paracoccus aurantiacus]|uniref:Extracellular solute-binding protein n=1 Tax=Paracoccus aurantiacus TaxID=2599412 RepID=A0A5C6S5S3_9RHOB|nr:extracellular solute-binding protein [Paracoccus aurantiacus]TXB69341.1 extracellular solute-binding protein [Paracoccus aurantiacus]
MNTYAFRLSAVIFASASCLAAASHAECGIEAGNVSILANDFEALHVIATAAEECASPTVTVTKNHTTEHANLQGPALTANPSTYTVVMIANDSISGLLSTDKLLPLDDLVAEYGGDLQESQLIRVDGQVMAIAFMVNAQHLWLRKDILDKAGLAQPTTYEEVLAAAEAIREQGLMAEPLAASYKPGWDLAADFVNMYSGFGGELFAPDGSDVAIENDQGVKALEMMKALSAFMGPDYLTFNTNEMSARWRDNLAAIENGWGSRAGQAIDPAQTPLEIADATVFAAAPTVGGGTIPATTMWWDGFALARNISEEDATASFRAMMHALRPETAEAHPKAATWLIEGYQPTPAAAGVLASMEAGAKPYPMVPAMGLLHRALGDELADFMQDREDAQTALADAASAYRTAAREAGFLK